MAEFLLRAATRQSSARSGFSGDVIMRLLPAERFIVNVILALAAIDTALIAYKGVSVDIPGYLGAFGTGGSMIALGQFYRSFRQNEDIALATSAAGLFIVFTIVGSVFNYLLLPIQFGPYDDVLIRIDAALGYSWPGLLSWMAQHVWLSELLRFVYLSSLPQMLLVILILGFTGRSGDLHRFLLTGVIAGLGTICVWSVFPTFGTSGMEAIPADAQAALQLVVGKRYGAELMRLAAEGAGHISPKDVIGLIGFPSFHTVMACLSAWFMATFRKLQFAFIVLNIFMIPSILVHGGHHLMDVLGGLVMFALSMQLSGIALRQMRGRGEPRWTAQAPS
jgi:PAP2 superfamily